MATYFLYQWKDPDMTWFKNVLQLGKQKLCSITQESSNGIHRQLIACPRTNRWV